MNKAIVLGITLLAMIALVASGIAGAQDPWNVQINEFSFQLPGHWLLDEETEEGFEEWEMAWYQGDFDEPSHYLVMAFTEGIAEFLDIFIMDDEEDYDILSDETIQLLGKEGRMVVLYDDLEEGFLVYLVLEGVLRTGEDLFMMVGVLEEQYETFKPELDQLLASFSLNN